jgi:type II secretory pathway pseudopilin PulG
VPGQPGPPVAPAVANVGRGFNRDSRVSSSPSHLHGFPLNRSQPAKCSVLDIPSPWLVDYLFCRAARGWTAMRAQRVRNSRNEAHGGPSEAGFSLLEALVAITILSAAVISIAHLLVTSTRANLSSRKTTRAVILAEQKLSQLEALAWTLDDGGGRVDDVGTNVAAFAATPTCPGASAGAAVGLAPSPPGALVGNVDGYVDYVDARGCGLGGGTSPPAGAAHVRRWSITRAGGTDTLVFEVLVTSRVAGTAGGGNPAGRLPDEARLVGAKVRRMP